MRTVTVTRTDDVLMEFELPDDPDEITLRAKLDFDFGSQTVLDYLISVTEENPLNTSYYLYLVAQCLTDFFISNGAATDLDLADLLAIDVADLLDSTGVILPGVLHKHLEKYAKGDLLAEDTVSPTILALFDHITAVIAAYEFRGDVEADFSFTYKDELFVVPRQRKDKLYGIVYDKISIGELTEAFEISKQLAKRNDANTASTLLTEMLMVIAIIARKKDEPFPIADKDAFMRKRAEFFLDLDYPTASNVFFYLTPSSASLISGMTSDTFLNHLKDLLKESQVSTKKT